MRSHTFLLTLHPWSYLYSTRWSFWWICHSKNAGL